MTDGFTGKWDIKRVIKNKKGFKWSLYPLTAMHASPIPKLTPAGSCAGYDSVHFDLADATLRFDACE